MYHVCIIRLWTERALSVSTTSHVEHALCLSFVERNVTHSAPSLYRLEWEPGMWVGVPPMSHGQRKLHHYTLTRCLYWTIMYTHIHINPECAFMKKLSNITCCIQGTQWYTWQMQVCAKHVSYGWWHNIQLLMWSILHDTASSLRLAESSFHSLQVPVSFCFHL